MPSNIIYLKFNKPDDFEDPVRIQSINIYLRYLLFFNKDATVDIDQVVIEALAENHTAELYQSISDEVRRLIAEPLTAIEMTVEAQRTTLYIPLTILNKIEAFIVELPNHLSAGATPDETTLAVIRTLETFLTERGYRFPVFIKRMIVNRLLSLLS